MKTKTMSEDKFWEIVETVNWGSDNDYERIREYFLANISKEDAIEFRRILSDKFNTLDKMIDGRNPQNGGDDSYSDLLHHVIGLGQIFYYNCLRSYNLLKETNEVESFAYAIPYGYEYDTEKEEKELIKVDIKVTVIAQTTVTLKEGESALDVTNRLADIYLHGAGEHGYCDKTDIGGDTEIEILKVRKV